MVRHTINRRRWLIRGVFCLRLFLVVLDTPFVGVCLPTLSRALGSSTGLLQVVRAAYA